MRRFTSVLAFILLALLFIILPPLVSGQGGVEAEAIGQANLRARPDVNAPLVGEITAGTRYPVIGRSEFFPWLLLGNPQDNRPIGWVFQDLVTVFGTLSTVPYSTVDVSDPFIPTSTPGAPTVTGGPTGSPLPVTPTPSFSVTGRVSNEINIRYGPGIDYTRIGVAQAGDVFEITAYHTQFPWVQVRYDQSPTGFAWIAIDLLEIDGDIYSLPAISQLSFDLPTLTATPPPVLASVQPGFGSVPLSPEFQQLGNRIWEIVLSAGFDPATSRVGAVYLRDLQTGEAITFGNTIAFSGTSINKIAILVALYGLLENPPSGVDAVDIANTMICSENVATNRLLGLIGDGDLLRGADLVTQFLQQMGVLNTFLAAPYNTTLNPQVATSTPVPRALNIPETQTDQTSANPDPFNQLTVDDMGYLLSSVYECAFNESGPLMDTFPGQYTGHECRTILNVMNNNTVDALLRSGVPADIPVAHKHGWTDESHGNAAIIFTPGGNYVMVMMLHEPIFLQFTQTLPVFAEASRAVYNYYNPDSPMTAIRESFIPTTEDCNFAGDPLILEITDPFFEPDFGVVGVSAEATPESEG
jgi:beta-lactamase class A